MSGAIAGRWIFPFGAGSKGLAYIAALLLAIGVALAYLNSFSVGFILDDSSAIVDNLSIRNISSALSPPSNTSVTGRPMLNLTLAFNYAFGELDVYGYHAGNLLIHYLNALLLFTLLSFSFSRGGGGAVFGHPLLLALMAAFFWAVHPLQTESVTYLTQRAESLAALFVLSVVVCLAKSERSAKRTRWLILGGLSAFVGVTVKETVSVAPLLALAYDRAHFSSSFGEALRKRKWFYATLASSWLPLAALVLSTGGRGASAGFDAGVSSLTYAGTQTTAILHYAGLVFWPVNLVFDYGPYIETRPFWLLVGIGATVTFVAMTAFGLVRGFRPAFWGAWFILLVAPSSSIIPVATQTMAEHRVYLADAGIIVLAVLAGAFLWRELALRLNLGAVLPLGLAFVIGTALILATVSRNVAYIGREELWRESLAFNPENFRAHSQLGRLLLDNGRYDEAVASYKMALALSPDNIDVQNLYGAALAGQGDLGGAEDILRGILRANPENVKAMINLGDLLDSKGDDVGARELYEMALRLESDNAYAHNNLGVMLIGSGEVGLALAHFEAATRKSPGFANAQINLGRALIRLGRHEEAARAFRKALQANPSFEPARVSLEAEAAYPNKH